MEKYISGMIQVMGHKCGNLTSAQLEALGERLIPLIDAHFPEGWKTFGNVNVCHKHACRPVGVSDRWPDLLEFRSLLPSDMEKLEQGLPCEAFERWIANAKAPLVKDTTLSPIWTRR